MGLPSYRIALPEAPPRQDGEALLAYTQVRPYNASMGIAVRRHRRGRWLSTMIYGTNGYPCHFGINFLRRWLPDATHFTIQHTESEFILFFL